MRTVAIMQPYFFPYAGYFRLFSATDLFVIFDCVQFPRRGWVHRNQLPNANGDLTWLTLPLEKAPRDATISSLRLRSDASTALQLEMRRFPALQSPSAHCEAIKSAILPSEGEVMAVDYLERLLGECCKAMGIPFNVLRSSSLKIGDDIHGAERIIAIARRLGAQRYVNAPGGRALYGREDFAHAGLELRFLTEYSGAHTSILYRLITEPSQLSLIHI